MKAPETYQPSSVNALTAPRTSGLLPRAFAALHEPELYARKPNRTGLPDGLKAGIEALSGVSLDDVKVTYNSTKPAGLNALAFAQGSNIHVGPGQEQHLPHEAWHLVQQKQGRVQPTLQMKGGVAVNDNSGLESEADVMGNQAAGLQPGETGSGSASHASGCGCASCAGTRVNAPQIQPAAASDHIRLTRGATSVAQLCQYNHKKHKDMKDCPWPGGVPPQRSAPNSNMSSASSPKVSSSEGSGPSKNVSSLPPRKASPPQDFRPNSNMSSASSPKVSSSEGSGPSKNVSSLPPRRASPPRHFRPNSTMSSVSSSKVPSPEGSSANSNISSPPLGRRSPPLGSAFNDNNRLANDSPPRVRQRNDDQVRFASPPLSSRGGAAQNSNWASQPVLRDAQAAGPGRSGSKEKKGKKGPWRGPQSREIEPAVKRHVQRDPQRDVRRLGGRPIVIGVTDRDRGGIQNELDILTVQFGTRCQVRVLHRIDQVGECDGIFIPGGMADLPGTRSEEGSPQENLRTDRAGEGYWQDRVQLQYALAEHAQRHNIPILGVCGGSRCLAQGVGRHLQAGGTGGFTGYLDDAQEHIHNQNFGAPFHQAHMVQVQNNTRLGRMVRGQNYRTGTNPGGTTTIGVNSSHWAQSRFAAGSPANANVTRTAIAPDDVLEGWELQDQHFYMGVQWHPEFAQFPEGDFADPGATTPHQNIMRGLGDAATEGRAARIIQGHIRRHQAQTQLAGLQHLANHHLGNLDVGPQRRVQLAHLWLQEIKDDIGHNPSQAEIDAWIQMNWPD